MAVSTNLTFLYLGRSVQITGQLHAWLYLPNERTPHTTLAVVSAASELLNVMIHERRIQQGDAVLAFAYQAGHVISVQISHSMFIPMSIQQTDLPVLWSKLLANPREPPYYVIDMLVNRYKVLQCQSHMNIQIQGVDSLLRSVAQPHEFAPLVGYISNKAIPYLQ